MHDKIKKLAQEKGISIPNLEKELGMGNGTISKWAVCTPRADLLKKVADYFGVAMEYLLEDESVGA